MSKYKHPYHNSTTLQDIKDLENLKRRKRQEFQTKVIDPLNERIRKLKIKRTQELTEADRKRFEGLI